MSVRPGGNDSKRSPPEAKSATQLALELPQEQPRFSRESFVAGVEEDPLSTIDSWLTSSEWRLAICGPTGSGKSHLVAVVAAELGCAVHCVGADGILEAKLDQEAFVVDEVDRLADPKSLLELIEHAKLGRRRLALAGKGLPESWACELRDLETRLEAMPRIELSEPDEIQLRAVLQKMFEDRQTLVSASVVEYAAPRLPRTFEAARAFVNAVDKVSIQEGRPISKKLAGNVIDNL